MPGRKVNFPSRRGSLRAVSQSTTSGLPHVIFNFRERAVSDDYNREQQFSAYALADLLRRLHLTGSSEDEGGGKTTVASAIASPLRAIVFEGVRFRPEIGTINAFVEPGVLLAAFPETDPHPDDSTARLIHDPGVQTAGDLTLTAGGGGIRIDVVECQPSSVVTEADNRDIFDPGTGLFSPTLVNKVAKGRLSYRIRTGTAGAGFPGTASGWLPIAVCSVPSAATTWDDVTVWDVRPLASDLARGPHLEVANWPEMGRQHAAVIDVGGGEWRAFGIVEGELSGWKLGGNLAPAQSGVSYLRLDALVAALNVQEPGFAAVASRPWYLYLAQPFGLPRWAKLSPATALERTPQSPRGIPVFTQKGPAGVSGKAGTALALPSATGLGSTTTNAAIALSGGYAAGAAFTGCTVAGGTDAGGGVFILAAASGNNTASPTFALLGNVTHPANATRIRLQVLSTITEAGADSYTLQRVVLLRDASANNYSTRVSRTSLALTAAGAYSDSFEVELELPPNLPAGTPQALELLVLYTAVAPGTIGAFSAQAVWVTGWTLG